MSQPYRSSLVGTKSQVLFEEPEGEFFVGHTPNYVKVYVKEPVLPNQIKTVTLTAPHKDGLLGSLEE
jgi:tRNA A37 methylthiotransferase MiaB